MIKFDLSELTPLERSAIEYMAGLEPRAEGEAPMGAEAYVAMTVGRSLETWKASLVEARLPALRPLAERYLNLEERGLAELHQKLAELEGVLTAGREGEHA